MSDGQADKRAREAGLTPEQRRQRERSASTRAQCSATKPREPAPTRLPATVKPLVSLDDPDMFAGEAMRAALTARDVTLIYRLYEGGVTSHYARHSEATST
ncbi:MAG: hypothetical protein ACRDSZ_10040 [Pseudonocardiaceae bacterium]